MKNSFFDIDFNSENGTVRSIVNPDDPHKMNWCIENEGWGTIRCGIIGGEFCSGESAAMELTDFFANDEECRAVYANADIEVTAERFFSSDGCFNERYTLKNLRDGDLFLEHGDIGITIPFNDIYTYADECMVSRCNTHLWCGGSTTYVNALKMGESEINLGLVLTKGAAASYSVYGTKTNHRGIFVLDCEHLELLKGEEYVIEWQMFWHRGNEDFYAKAQSYPNFIGVEAENYTVYDDEKIEFDLKTQLDAEKLQVCCGGKPVAVERNKNGCHVVFTPERLGEHRFEITVGDVHTYTDFFVSERPEKIMEKRIRFIIDKQQYHREGSPLDGAFLIYDNKEKYHVFDSVIRDHNACRERTGMALLMARYLQIHEDAEIRAALDRYITFLMREFFDAQTGEVFDGVGRNKKFKRLYNAPWITTLFTEMYRLTGDKTYLHHIVKMLEVYYDGGGTKFYPNGLSMYNTVTAFRNADMPQEAEKVMGLFTIHVNNMVKNGLSYPKHEVNYEQTIVSPAATFISEMARLTGDKKYTEEAQKHIAVLERFNGHQPSFHLHEIPIRFWDDFWFGKSRLFGDTFPHYWSCLTARAFTAYYKASGDKEYLDAAEKCIRNCMCLFNDKGEGSCAYVYPFRLNGEKGQFYDEWANDQDFALYFYLVNKECCGT